MGAWLDLERPSYFNQAEYRLHDLIARAGRTTPPNPDFVFLAIDSDSVALDPDLDVNGLFPSSASDADCRHALEIMSKGWPWDREIYAMIGVESEPGKGSTFTFTLPVRDQSAHQESTILETGSAPKKN